MAVRYQCPNCERKFIDWGAEKLGYKCPDPDCEGEELTQMGLKKEEGTNQAPSLKRKPKKKAAAKPPKKEVVPEDIEDDSEELSESLDENSDDEGGDSAEVVVDDDSDDDDSDDEEGVEDLDFEDSASGFKDQLKETGDQDN